jgi:hypothetical protein
MKPHLDRLWIYSKAIEKVARKDPGSVFLIERRILS